MNLKLKKSSTLIVIGLFSVTSTTAMERMFRSAEVHAKDFSSYLAVKPMGEALSKASGGKDNIKVFAGSSLGSEADTIEQGKIGALDMVRVSSAAFNGVVPKSVIPLLAALTKSLSPQ